VDIWYELIETFYKLQNLVSWFAIRRAWREKFTRALQGNPYGPETQRSSRVLLDAMHRSYETVMADPNNLLRPWSFDEMLRQNVEWHDSGGEAGPRFLPCPMCGGKVRLDPKRELLVCTSCGRDLPMMSSSARLAKA
jgi:hypothetical protein